MLTRDQWKSVDAMWREITRGREWLSGVMELEGEDRFTTDEVLPAIPALGRQMDRALGVRS